MANIEEEARSAGLVSIPTSVTVEREKSRLRRMKRSVLTSARLIQEQTVKGGSRYYCAMLTTTYAPESEWRKRHITELIVRIRQYLKRRGYPLLYVWTMELTKVGVPHFHILIWLPRGVTLPKPDKRGWWPHGSTRIEWARNPVGYIVKYASKGTKGHEIPKGARLQSSGGLTKESRAERSWWLAPQYVRERWSIDDLPCRAPGGGWMSRVTGDWIPSPWVIVDRAPDWSWVKLGRRDALVVAQ